MVYLKWLLLIVTSLVVDISGLFIVPIALLFIKLDNKLSKLFWPWDNDREPLGDTDRKAEMDAATGFHYWYLRWHWLAIRNPGNNFGYLCGIVPTGNFTVVGDLLTSDQGHPGKLWVKCDNAFCWYSVWNYSGHKDRCLRIFLGWKIQDLAKTNAEIVLVVNPVMTFRPNS